MHPSRVQLRPRRRPPLRLLPLGGCGEIGMNLTLYGYDDQWIAVDCGMMIRQDLPNSPLQVPNMETLEALKITPKALFITHGHEDHIGAVAWLWPKWGCPIFATPLAAGLLRYKFAEHQLSSAAIQTIEPGEAVESSPFTLRYLSVTHSIPESCAIMMQAGDYRILHTGDWKLDPTPLIGAPVSAAALWTVGWGGSTPQRPRRDGAGFSACASRARQRLRRVGRAEKVTRPVQFGAGVG